MVVYKCNKCSIIFDKKGHFDQHKRRKTSCVSKNSGSKTQRKLPTIFVKNVNISLVEKIR